MRNYLVRLFTGLVAIALLGSLKASANEILTNSNLSLSAGVLQAKQNGMPLIVFGTNVGCHNCAGVKKSIDNSQELQLLMKQYVAVEISAGSSETNALIKSTSKGNNGPLPTPIVFIFTAKGENVYATPNIPLTELKKSLGSYKETLINGIAKNGGLHNPAKAASGVNLASDISKAQKWNEAFIFFKHEDSGTAPKYANKFVEVVDSL